MGNASPQARQMLVALISSAPGVRASAHLRFRSTSSADDIAAADEIAADDLRIMQIKLCIHANQGKPPPLPLCLLTHITSLLCVPGFHFIS